MAAHNFFVKFVWYFGLNFSEKAPNIIVLYQYSEMLSKLRDQRMKPGYVNEKETKIRLNPFNIGRHTSHIFTVSRI